MDRDLEGIVGIPVLDKLVCRMSFHVNLFFVY